jgi:hypothetical protein
MIKYHERSGNFADVVKPGKGTINIIDYLELHDEFYKVGGLLADIQKKLDGAIAIVALQKKPSVDVGLGGYRSIKKPRLAVAVSPGKIKIVKAKHWKTHDNPNGLQRKFKLAAGCKLFADGQWYRE